MTKLQEFERRLDQAFHEAVIKKTGYADLVENALRLAREIWGGEEDYDYTQDLRSEIYDYLHHGYKLMLPKWQIRNNIMNIFDDYKCKEAKPPKPSTEYCECRPEDFDENYPHWCGRCHKPIKPSTKVESDIIPPTKPSASLKAIIEDYLEKRITKVERLEPLSYKLPDGIEERKMFWYKIQELITAINRMNGWE